ncbi:hypothetical protein [Sinorhizobium meliloti]|uniref:hypothetical protein n=1 Tax=Rhizobium meliloti TaxID=382 RepID=UPI0018E8E82B|nr:hypothetical protein [Sinorhizobium meliloti]QQF06229.1 hypothetical protein JFX10_24785 [Sinorhizobium meliloti]
MPIVFVHGVNNRKEDAGFDDDVGRKTEFFKTLLAAPLGFDASKLTITFPYWGGDGVKFLWNQVSLPGGEYETLALGAQNNEIELWLCEAQQSFGGKSVVLGTVSREKSFADAVDLIWDAAAATANSSQNIGKIAEAYQASQRYIQKYPAPAWAIKAEPLSNEAFVDALLKGINELPAEEEKKVETLGLSGWLQSTKEALARLGSVPSDAATAATLALARKSTHQKASRFLGDVFVYLKNRGTVGAPGPIVKAVLQAFQDADATRRPGDDKLIIVGHSLGGVITYDILSYFAPDLKVDYLVTVGSQVGLFEEMALYSRALPAGMPTDPKKDRVAANPNIGKWLNVFDTNDVFSFSAEGIYKSVKDYQYDTGYGGLGAHGGYFARPSFYKRLRARLSE